VPLLEITALPSAGDVDVDEVLVAVNASVAAVVGCRPEAVWSTWRTLDRYAVGSAVTDRQPHASHAPIVHLYVNRPPDVVERICDAVAEVLGERLSVAPENVFVTVQPVFAANEAG
jgi:hypothetical protein